MPTPGIDRLIRRYDSLRRINFDAMLRKVADSGVRTLAKNTPVDTGETAQSWGHTIAQSGDAYLITWTNQHTSSGVSVALLIQYGHATPSGRYVSGINFINPALNPVYKDFHSAISKEIRI